MRYCGIPHNVAAALTVHAGFSDKTIAYRVGMHCSRVFARLVSGNYFCSARPWRSCEVGRGALQVPFGMVYACGHPVAEGFDDKRLPDKQQVSTGECAALSRVMRADALADYAFGQYALRCLGCALLGGRSAVAIRCEQAISDGGAFFQAFCG